MNYPEHVCLEHAMSGPLHCGHPFSVSSPITDGSAILSNGERICYDCALRNVLRDMLVTDRLFQYVSGDGTTLTTWTGQTLGLVTYWGEFHPWSHERRYVNVTDIHGQQWHGTASPGMWASLRKSVSLGGAS